MYMYMHMETITEYKVIDRPPNTQNAVYTIINACSLVILYIYYGENFHRMLNSKTFPTTQYMNIQ